MKYFGIAVLAVLLLAVPLVTAIPFVPCPGCRELYQNIIGSGEPEPLYLGCTYCVDQRRVTALVRARKGSQTPEETLSNPWIKALTAEDEWNGASVDRGLRGNTVENARPAIPALIRAALMGRNPVRGKATWFLGSMGPEASSAVPTLLTAFQDPRHAGRAQVALALGRIRSDPDRVIPALIAGLRDAHPLVRMTSAMALRDFGAAAKSAITALTTALNDPDFNVRGAAAQTLGLLGPEARSAIPELEKLLGDADSNTAFYAKEAFKRLRDR